MATTKKKPPALPASSAAAHNMATTKKKPPALPASSAAAHSMGAVKKTPPPLPSSEELEAIRQRVDEQRSRTVAVSNNGQQPRTVHASWAEHDAFESLDADHSGALDTKEIRAAFQMRAYGSSLLPDEEQRLNAVVEMFDANGDGKLDEDEFENMLQEIMRQPKCLCNRQTIHGHFNGWLLLVSVLSAGLLLVVGMVHCCSTEDRAPSPSDGDEVQIIEGFGKEATTTREGQCSASRHQKPTCAARSNEEILPPAALGEPVAITVKIRDFDNTHIHFGCGGEAGSVGEGCGWNNGAPSLGMVEAELDADGKMVLVDETEENIAAFASWFSDSGEVHVFDTYLLFELDSSSGFYQYDSNRYLPLDTQPAGLFTTEIHLPFRYKGGEVFEFRGDDDVWVFINGRLALDLGGCHVAIPGSINLDAQAASLEIVVGRVYDMALFQAERCFGASNFKAELSPGLLSPPTYDLDSEFCLLPSCKDEDDEGASGDLTEPTCPSRQYTPPRCHSSRCTMVYLPLLSSFFICAVLVSLLPETFTLRRSRRRLCPSCLASMDDRAWLKWALKVAVLVMVLLIVAAVAWWYISMFSCCATMQACTNGADEWESEPWILTASNSVAVESIATWQKGGSMLRVEHCTGALAEWYTPDCSDDVAGGALCLGDWTCWTACSADCGGGSQSRTAEDASALQSTAGCDSKACNTHDCAVCGDDLGLCLLDDDSRPDSRDRDGLALLCCCWALLAAALVAILPLLLALLWVLCNRPQGDKQEEDEAAGVEDSQPTWVVFLLDPGGVRHAVEVMSSEFTIATVLEKSAAATGIPAKDIVLKFGGRVLREGKQLTSYGVQHGSELVVESNGGAAVETRQQRRVNARRQIHATRGRQGI